MINEDVKITKKEKMDYPPIPKDIYQAEIFDINLKDAKGQYAQEGEKVFSFQFTLLEGKDKGKDLRGRNVWNNFVPTYLYIGKKGKNSLYRIIEAVLGRELEAMEEATFDKTFVNSLIGQQLRLLIEPRVAGDRTYDNTTDFLAITEKLPTLTKEEREKAKVKKKEGSSEKEMEVNPNLITEDEAFGDSAEINVDEIL